MTTTTSETLSLQVARFIKAPRERVFEAWTNADELPLWLGCVPIKVVSSKIDLRIGGEYAVHTITEERGEMKFRGVYREIKAPEKLVFTWTGCCPEMLPNGTIVTVELIEQNGGTLLQLTHVGFPNDEVREKHNFGWNVCFDNLEKRV